MESGERRLQELAGTEKRARAFREMQVLDRLNGKMRAFIARQELVMLATADARGACDCTFRAGPPGFVRVLGPTRILIPEYRGNGVFASLGNVLENPHIACLFMDFVEAQVGLHVHGRASLLTPEEARNAGGELPGDGGPEAERWILVQVEEAYVHCAKHVPRFAKQEREIQWGTDDAACKKGDYFGAKPARRGPTTRAALPALDRPRKPPPQD